MHSSAAWLLEADVLLIGVVLVDRETVFCGVDVARSPM
jgi:hypothetical protein